MSAVMDIRESSAEHLSTLQPPLVQHFELMASAPGGVARLRELILTLAVQGKLVPQEPNDEPASELLKKIRAEKERLIAKGRIKRDKPLAEITKQETPFTLPDGWKWVRLGEIGLVGSSSRVHQGDWKGSGVPFYRAREIVKLSKDGHVANELFIAEEHFASLTLSGWVPEENDIMITGVGTIGIPYVVRPSDRFYFKDASVLIFKNYGQVNAQWLTLMMQSPLWIQGIHEYSMGTTVDTLTIARANIALLPLPPAAEQSRIVTRVEELMRLCDALEAKGKLESAQHAQLVQTLLGALTASTSPEELADNWQRVASHSDLLLDRPEAIDALEQTILQLAVRGLLVPQDPMDEPASVLLQRIRAERDRLITNGKIKRDKPVLPVEEAEQAFELPKGWDWVRMGDVVITSEAGWSPTCIGSPRRKGYWGVLKVSAVSWGSFDANANKELPSDLSPRPEYEVRSGDFLLSRANTEELVARSVVVGEVEPQLMLSDKIIRLDVSTLVNREFLNLSNNSYHSRAHYAVNASGTSSSMKNVSREVVLRTPIPLPPLAEQSRIVARIESLRRLCADLRQRLAAGQITQTQLAQALIDEVA